MMCDKCKKMMGVLLLVLGIVFLLVDLGKITFWGINWWTALILLMGLAKLCTSCCPMCQAADKKGKKK